MDDDTVEYLLAAADQLLGLQTETGKSVRGRSKEKFGVLIDSRMLVVGAIGSAIARRDGERTKIVGESQRQSVLIAAFIQGINVVESSISEGYYIQLFTKNARCL